VKGPIASIDLGTNSARLLIGRFDARASFRKLVLRRVITRLGGDFSKTGGISAEACKRSLETMREFAAELRRSGVSQVRAVATSAVRDAVNGAEFVAEVFRETGIRLEIIDGTEEALLTLRGVFSSLAGSRDNLVFDIGGGSTEYTLARGTTCLLTRSLPLGVVRLTEGKGTMDAMDEKITRELAGLRREIGLGDFDAFLSCATLVGTAGTATTLAAIDMRTTDFDCGRVHGHVLSLDTIREIFNTILPLSPEQRLLVPGIERGREDLITAGTLLTIRTMELFGFERMTVSDTGLLEGVLFELRDKSESESHFP